MIYANNAWVYVGLEQESNPQYLEDHLLTQIRVLTESQTLLVWVYGKTAIRVKVNSVHTTVPSASATSECPYLITDETEIVVSPKPRLDPGHDAKQQHQILKGEEAREQQSEQQDGKAYNEICKQKFKLLPQGATMVQTGNSVQELHNGHPELPPDSPHGQPVESEGDEDQDKASVVRIHPGQFRHLEAIYPSTLCSLAPIPRSNQLASIKPPIIASGAPDQDHSTSLPNLKPNHTAKPKHSRQRHVNAERVRLEPDASIPWGYVSVPPRLRKMWFGTQTSNEQIGHPGDYETVK